MDPNGLDGEPYKVKKGDNLSKIASRIGNGVTAEFLAKLNGIKNPNKIRPGQMLSVGNLPTPAEAQEIAGYHQLTDEDLQSRRESEIAYQKAYATSMAVNNWNYNIGPNLAMMSNAVAEFNAPYQSGGAWGEVNSGANSDGAGNTAWINTNSSITTKSVNSQVGKGFGGLSYTLSENGLININGRSVTNGTFDFVVTNESKLIIGSGHYNLSGEANSVQAAGQIQIYHGQVLNINNSSGHYQPSINQALNFKNILQSIGVNISRANLNLYNATGAKTIKIKN